VESAVEEPEVVAATEEPQVPVESAVEEPDVVAPVEASAEEPIEESIVESGAESPAESLVQLDAPPGENDVAIDVSTVEPVTVSTVDDSGVLADTGDSSD
jgi:hypothetical protein